MKADIDELVFLLEEKSAKEVLKNGLIQQLVPENIAIRYIVFEGKQDLEKGISRKLKAWMNKRAVFVIMRDQDSEDNCIQLKQRLAQKCTEAGKPDTLIRIVCRELESWYLGDLQAVETGLKVSGLAKKQTKYPRPDSRNNAKQELIRLSKNQYQSVSGSRRIIPYLNLDNNTSVSFRVFVEGVRRLFQ